MRRVLFILVLFLLAYVVPLPYTSIRQLNIPYSNLFYAADLGRSGKPILIACSSTGHLRADHESRVKRMATIQVPEKILKTLLFKEDKTFYDNFWGINWTGLARALIRNSGGGSGIVQQEIKNLFFVTPKGGTIRNLNRKLTELVAGLNFDRTFSREELLVTYLNNVYFAPNIYGYEMGAQYHFNKPLRDLSWAEAVTLVNFGQIPCPPNKWRNKKYRTAIREKRNKRLRLMREEGILSKSEYNAAVKSPVKLVNELQKIIEDDQLQEQTLFVAQAKNEFQTIMDSLQINPTGGNYRIYTTLNRKVQRKMEQTVSLFFRNIPKRHVFRGRGGKKMDDTLQLAAYCIERQTGLVRGMLGARPDIELVGLNYCHRPRPAGSTFKLIPYYLFLNKYGVDENEPLDVSVVRNGYTPNDHVNYKAVGSISLKEAIRLSLNRPVCNLVNNKHLNLEEIVVMAERFGYKISQANSIPLVLGQDDISLANNVNLYRTVADNGYSSPNYYIRKITDDLGNVLFERRHISREYTLNHQPCRILKRCLWSVVNEGGTASSVRQAYARLDAAGKTGTTNDNTNVWFIGWNDQLVMGIWIGFSKSNSRNSGFKSSDCARLWGQIMAGVN